MKKGLVFLLLSMVGVARCQTGISLAGKVVDAVSNKPLSNCSVYLNNTSIGTITSEDGAFLLKNIPHGRADMVISAIGYATYVLHLRSDSLPKDLRVNLRQNATELSSFVVESYLKDGWKQWGKFFLENFIGTTGNAGSCILVNRKALRFHYLKKSRRLTVSATEPLIIHNKALGYDLQYQLEHFSYEEDTHIVFYQGYPLFREMSTSRGELRQRWVEGRKKAWLGSLHHFIQSLYKDQLSPQGFLLEHTVRVCNAEKQRVKQVYDPNAAIGAYSRDSLYYYWKVMKEADTLGLVKRANPGELLSTQTGGGKALSFEGPLTVRYYYQREPLPGDYWESHLTLLRAAAVEIEENGGYFPPEDMLADGYWAQSEKICNLLPLDYVAPGKPGQ
ncbi:MAG TPA: carboxypeptidase-like regulatory domain-containing protein [Puia sp.]|nr:carboxypeptidase-like regulatory domain-containing protein [Puia sp.]